MPSRYAPGSRSVADEMLPPDELEALQEQLAALGIEDFLVSAASTVASLAYAKLERGDLDQAKKGIDALASLVPHLEGGFRRDLSATLANLQVAYATAAS
jgi:hypothetical protein